ncbi:MAG: FAD dependent oxidoreductase [uncultured Thermomicrobiales bacterium]|uniref:FAD dependent oxidoreductase n=1 Tax=uncultured Thermomicrobiales bacterium TaxID=1645740 RepID=A0A6J4VKI9_9BACT|nr:MAG: FAD dependent oxidoreductase [uncultured Thermomicrobiales bacterium]
MADPGRFETTPGGYGDLPRSADVVVIGGGVTGASTAFQLAKRGVGVTLLEQRELGAGATGKSGALVRAHYTNPVETALTLESLRIFAAWDEVVGAGSPRFEAVGFVQVVAPEDEPHLRANVAAHQALGVETAVVSAADLAEIEPLMRTDDLTHVAFEPKSGYADPLGTLYGFAAAATRHGASVREGTAATAIATDPRGRVVGVDTTRGRIATESVVLAGGAWANRLLAPLGVDLGLTPRRIQVVVFRWPRGVDQGRRHRVVIDATTHAWFRPEGATGTVIGVETGGRTCEPDGYGETADAAYVDAARAALAHRFPAFAHATMRGAWAGMIMMSVDSRPLIGPVPEVPGLYVIAGDSGTSFKTAPAIGVCLAELLTEGTASPVDLTPFRPSRFAEGLPWRDEHTYGGVEEHLLTISR